MAEVQNGDEVLRVAIALPGMHRVVRGAEIAFEALAERLATRDDTHVTVFGSGDPRPEAPYEYEKIRLIQRERFRRFPSLPLLRREFRYEEATFVPGLLQRFRSANFDVTLTTSLPSTWALTGAGRSSRRPPNVFVTNNGADSPAGFGFESKLFGSAGVVATNPMFHDDIRSNRWLDALIPNGVDTAQFAPGPGDRKRFGIPGDGPVVLMASALYPDKRVLEGAKAVAAIPDATLVVAGDGPLRDDLAAFAREHLDGRFSRVKIPHADMPVLYRSCDALLHMTFIEPFGNIYVEAAACGLPVVAHDSPASRWISEGSFTLLETTDLAAVTAALEHSMTPTAQEQASASAADVQRRFSWERVAEQYRAFLGEVVDRSRQHETLSPR